MVENSKNITADDFKYWPTKLLQVGDPFGRDKNKKAKNLYFYKLSGKHLNVLKASMPKPKKKPALTPEELMRQPVVFDDNGFQPIAAATG